MAVKSTPHRLGSQTHQNVQEEPIWQRKSDLIILQFRDYVVEINYTFCLTGSQIQNMVLPLKYFGVFSVSIILLPLWPKAQQEHIKGGKICIGSRFQRDFSHHGKEGMEEGTCGSGCLWKRSKGYGEGLGVALILKGLPTALLLPPEPNT